MARLFRPHIPIATKCLVALRGIGHMWPEQIIEGSPNKSALLKSFLAELAEILHCEVGELRLDHDPPLGAREKVPERQPKPNHKWFNSFGVPMRYEPEANDPDYLRYRPHGAQHKGSHDIKTRVRGDHGQFSDLALIRREKKRAKKLKKNPRTWRATGIKKPIFASGKIPAPTRIHYIKRKWPKRSFPKRNKQ